MKPQEGFCPQFQCVCGRIPHFTKPFSGISWVSYNLNQLWQYLLRWFRFYRICLQCGRPRFTPCVGTSPGIGNGKPVLYSCLGNHTERGNLQATAHAVTESRTQLSDETTKIMYYFRKIDTMLELIVWYKIIIKLSLCDTAEQYLHLWLHR